VPPVVEYQIPSGSGELRITAGPDGNIWVAEGDADKIARVTLSGTVTEFSVPTAAAFPGIIEPGPDGSLWFAEYNTDTIGRITTAGGVTEFPLPASMGTNCCAVAAGPDGNVWFTHPGANVIGVMSTSGMLVATYPIPTANSGAGLIVKGSDGNMWFAEGTANKIGRITISGTITEFTIPTPNADSFGTIPGLVEGNDGNIWFTERPAATVGRLTPAGVFTEFPVPTSGFRLQRITATSDGNLWFAAWQAVPPFTGSQIFRMDLTGVVVDAWAFDVAQVRGLTTGPDQNIWFVDEQNGLVGRL
jgi:virginiamycin B lyase